jgi:outer membrane protein
MKERVFMIFSIAILSLFFWSTQTIAAEKTGFVDIREIMTKSELGKKATGELSKSVEKNRAKIQPKEAELKKLKDELEKQKSILTESAMKEKEMAYQKKLRDYQLQIKDSNDELQAEEQELTKKLIPEVLKVIRVIGEREKYTLILDVSTSPIAYYAKENDLTARVVEELNKTKPTN